MPALEKAIITNTVSGENISVFFNPEEYTVNQDNNFAQVSVPGRGAPILQFVNGNMKTLEMELLVDTYEEHSLSGAAGTDVRELTSKITGLMAIDPSIHAPPVLIFTWGSLSFTCVLARASQRFIMFLPSGIPVRARLQVTFNEFNNLELEAKEIKRETADYTHLHITSQGETISSIAAQVYQDPKQWRPIAIHNQIDNPHDLQPGMQLLIPQLPFRDPQTGEVIS